MSATQTSVAPRPKVRVRGIALPTEHGAWGFLFEPIVASLAVAFSPGGAWIAVAFVGAFLTRQPLKILLADVAAGRRAEQTSVALRFVLLFGAVFLIGAGGAAALTDAAAFVPLLIVAPLGVYQIFADATRRSRGLVPELTGAVAISSSAAVIALAGGWTFAAACGLWAVFIARLVPSILYVRNRLRLEKGKSYSAAPVWIANLGAVAAVWFLAARGLAPFLTVATMVVLTVRAGWGLSPYRRRVKAMKIGVWEVIYGTLTALSVIIGYYFRV